jgi:hypothetical protein
LTSRPVKADAKAIAATRGRVSALFISAAVGILTLGFGVGGLMLRRFLPEVHMTAGSRDVIGAIVGLVTLLLALVLGTLVGSAYNFFATQRSNLESLGAHSIQLDIALAQYGPEAQPLRDGLRAALKDAYNTIWGGGASDPRKRQIQFDVASMTRLDEAVSSLKPETPLQTKLMPAINANAGAIEQTRLLMAMQLASPVSWPLLYIVVSLAVLLFCGFGVLSRLNLTSLVALALGAFAVASAIFLVLELNRPLDGLFRLPGASIEQTIIAMGG